MVIGRTSGAYKPVALILRGCWELSRCVRLWFAVSVNRGCRCELGTMTSLTPTWPLRSRDQAAAARNQSLSTSPSWSSGHGIARMERERTSRVNWRRHAMSTVLPTTLTPSSTSTPTPASGMCMYVSQVLRHQPLVCVCTCWPVLCVYYRTLLFRVPTVLPKPKSMDFFLAFPSHTRLTALCPGLPGWAGTRKVKPIWILLKQETVSGSGISWDICKSAPCCRHITMPATHRSVFTGQMPFLPPNQQCQSTEGFSLTAFSVSRTKFSDLYRDTFQYSKHAVICSTRTNYLGIWILKQFKRFCTLIFNFFSTMHFTCCLKFGKISSILSIAGTFSIQRCVTNDTQISHMLTTNCSTWSASLFIKHYLVLFLCHLIFLLDMEWWLASVT